jgi:hypothetical protein
LEEALNLSSDRILNDAGYLWHPHGNNNSLISKCVQIGLHIKLLCHFYLNLQNNTARTYVQNVEISSANFPFADACIAS